MAKLEDIRAILKAKENEIEEKGLRYADRGSLATFTAYNTDFKYQPLIDALNRTKDPKYIKIARFLELNLLTHDKEYDKTEVMIKNKAFGYPSAKVARTTYKEFVQIDKRARKTNSEHARTLNKFKDIKKFVRNDLDDLFEVFMGTPTLRYASATELTEFFDNSSIGKLRSSKLVKNVK